jgi:hypothetical protein
LSIQGCPFLLIFVGHTSRFYGSGGAPGWFPAGTVFLCVVDPGVGGPYSPDLNPIELMFSKLKNLLTRQNRTEVRLRQS